jgi:hypothetical protein
VTTTRPGSKLTDLTHTPGRHSRRENADETRTGRPPTRDFEHPRAYGLTRARLPTPSAEPRDHQQRLLNAANPAHPTGQTHLRSCTEPRKFWPSGGPHWDALAVAHGPDGDYLGPVLVEGKSYPGEMRSRLAAKNPVSRHRILARLAEARAWLRVSEDHADAWSERYYQAANRIAFLYWFHDVLDERAWLANVCFLDDPDYPTTKQRWDKALPKVERALGLEAVHVPGKGGIFLIAGRRDELLVSPPADSGVS